MYTWGCGMCEMDTAGHHELDCPMHKENKMPLPRDRYPDPDNTLASYALLKLERQRVAIAIVERDEARTWAIRMKRERDSCKVSINIWTTSRDYWKNRAEKAEREKDAANDAYNWMFERWNEAARTVKVLRVSRAHWRVSFERVSGERNRLVKQLEEDTDNGDVLRDNFDDAVESCRMWSKKFERAEQQKNKLAAALKKIKTMPFKTTERVFEVIDAALDGVEE